MSQRKAKALGRLINKLRRRSECDRIIRSAKSLDVADIEAIINLPRSRSCAAKS